MVIRRMEGMNQDGVGYYSSKSCIPMCKYSIHREAEAQAIRTELQKVHV